MGTDGQAVTHNGPFQGTSNASSPGSLSVQSGRSHFLYDHQGVYTCRIPDETGEDVDINVGIYQNGFSGEQCVLSVGIARV